MRALPRGLERRGCRKPEKSSAPVPCVRPPSVSDLATRRHGYMIGRLLSRLIYVQAGWAKPFGDFNVRWIRALFRPVTPVKDFLHGKWLGHSLHVTLTDLPIGVLTLAIVFDLFNIRGAADASIAFGILAMLAAAVAGLVDYGDTDDEPRMVATVHATLMVLGVVIYPASFWMRWSDP